LQKEEFENPQQARYKLRAINQKLNLVKILEIDLIVSQSKDHKTIYKANGVGQEITEEIVRRRKETGRFILATNLVDEEDKLDSAEMVTTYKNQQSCERGFRFLKDP